MFFDTHAHLTTEYCKKDEIEEILKNDIFVNIVGFDLDSSKEALEIANAHKNCFSSCGFHPYDVPKANEESLKELTKLLEDENWRKNLFKHLKSNIVFGGGEGAVQKFPVVHVNTVTVDGTYTVSGVKEGINIYGIDHSSDVTVYLPKTIPQDRMIYIKDVSGNANTYPITIQMEV